MKLHFLIVPVFHLLLFGAPVAFAQNEIHYTKIEQLVFDHEVAKYKLSGTDTLVDIGSWDGFHDELIFKFYPAMYFILEDIDAKCLEASKYGFKQGKQKLWLKDHSLKVMGTPDSIPLASAQYKHILCRLTLHEFTEPTRMLQEMKRIMAADGELIIVERLPAYEGQIEKWCQRKLLTETEIINLLATNGFKLISSDSTKYPKNKPGADAYILRFGR